MQWLPGWLGLAWDSGPVPVMADEPQAWTGITVEVNADRPVTTSHSVKEQADGFHRLAITLSNRGRLPLTIENITVRIPAAGRLTDDLAVLNGGSRGAVLFQRFWDSYRGPAAARRGVGRKEGRSNAARDFGRQCGAQVLA